MRCCLVVLLIFLAKTASAQETTILFDEGAESSGFFVRPDTLVLENGSIPLFDGSAYSGDVSGSLQSRHDGGRWEMAIHTGAAIEVSEFDSLVIYVNGPDSLHGAEFPRIGFENAAGNRSPLTWLSALRNVEVSDESGFTPESRTDVILQVRYSEVISADLRRPGYPENLTITFSDVPLDTSTAGIGAQKKPAKFKIVTESGLEPEFIFRDTDNDSTLSQTGEYIDILFPESYDSSRLVATWRVTLAPSLPLLPIQAGDVFELIVESEEFDLDSDPATWQRISMPVIDLLDEGSFEASKLLFVEGGRNPVLRTLWIDAVSLIRNDDEAFLEMLQKETFDYFWAEATPSLGLVKDRSTSGSPASIAAMGFGLSALIVGMEHGWITPQQGRSRILNTLRFLWTAPQSTAADATGYKGFFYHFLDMQTGRRAWNSELSTIDTALLLGGVLHAREYYREDEEIRSLADSIYYRVDWQWAQARAPAISHGWKPETGFLPHDWIGYNEAMILYILALGSPTHPVEPAAWDRWVSGYDWETHYGYSFVRFPPLFGHQYSHVWIDFRGIQDAYMRQKGIDYFENSRRATLAQRAYHVANPRNYPNYSKDEWGLTASDTPPPVGYLARGAPPAFRDDGTLVPTAPGGSIAFTPEESIAALRTMHRKYPRLWGPYGFRDAYNVSVNWFDNDYIGIDQGPILLMVENYRTGIIWEQFMQNEDIEHGLERAGFTGVGLASEELPRQEPNLSVFPNPSEGAVEVAYSIDQGGPVRLTLFDILGRRVAVLVDENSALGTTSLKADLSGLSPGIYIVLLETPRGNVTRSLVLVQ